MMELLNKLDACQEAKQWAAGRCGVNYPTCGEISCEECNDRYEKAMDRIAELEAMVRGLLNNWFISGEAREKALALLNQEERNP